MRTGILRWASLLVLLLVVGCEGNQPNRFTNPSDTTTTKTPEPPLPPYEPAIGGQYKLTITAAPECSLPTEAMQRTYRATVEEPVRGQVRVTLSGASFFFGAAQFAPGFAGTREGDALAFPVHLSHGGYGVAEQIDTTKAMYYDGALRASVGDGNISGTLSGQIYVYALPGGLYDWLADCVGDHKVQLTP